MAYSVHIGMSSVIGSALVLLPTLINAATVTDLSCSRIYREGRAVCTVPVTCTYGHGPANYTAEMDRHKDYTGDVSWAWRGRMCVDACYAGDDIVYDCVCLTQAQVAEANTIGSSELALCVPFIVIGAVALLYNSVVGGDDDESCFPRGHTCRWLIGTTLFCVGTAFLASSLSIPTDRYIDSGCENVGGPTPPNAGVNVAGVLVAVLVPVGSLLVVCVAGLLWNRYKATHVA
jgi:hypothetical protein